MTTEANDAPAGLPGLKEVDDQAPHENFPVALRVLPRNKRTDLLAVYGWARLVDDVGDEYDGDRLAALDWLEADLDRAFVGAATHPVHQRLTPTIHRGDLDRAPFVDLIEANRLDQHRSRYDTFDALVAYCSLSANPIGRLVLAIFDQATSDNMILSDDVCTALQIVEHLQDVGEDHWDGRVYLPLEDLAAHDVSIEALSGATTSAGLRSLIKFEADRAATLLDSGDELVGNLSGHARVAVAGFLAGGRAALDAISRADYDVLGTKCRPTKRRIARESLAVLVRSMGATSAAAENAVVPQ